MDPLNPSIPPTTRRLPAILASALALLLALLGCAVASGQTSGATTTPGASTPTATSAPTSGPAVHQVSLTVTPTTPYTSRFSVSCPQGEIALGGGWDMPQSARVVAAQITSATTWSVSLAPPQPINGGATAQTSSQAIPQASATNAVYVECLSGAPGAVVTQRGATDNLAPTPADTFNDNLGGSVSLCNAGETLVGGGFDLGNSLANIELEGSWPRSDAAPIAVPVWVFSLRNYDAVARPITRFAECLSGVAISASYPRQTGAFIFTGQIGSATVSCPAGGSLAGGGFQYRMHSPGPSHVGSLFSLNATSAGWQTLVLMLSGYGLYALTPLAAAVCLTFATP
ncbi:MAG TPA: hypothetical protein VHR15_06045 [Ktedonobacterales bacterium]|jgi:hypothetical protein|nr:hypothetical protein [Ktedonobacterales bacterium]